MSDRVWSGFNPDTRPLPDVEVPTKAAPPAKKSTQDQLDEIDEQLAALEEKRKELLYAEAREKILEDEDGSLHKDCHTQEDIDAAVEDATDEEIWTAWDLLEEYGSHTAACLAGALVGSQEGHPLCTCGWNHVATELERR